MGHYLEQLQISPEHPHSFNGIGTTLHDGRRYEDAIFFYQTQLVHNERNKYSHLNMSLAYARLKQYEDAEREHRVQLKIHPADKNSNEYFIELLNEMKKMEEAVKFFSDRVKRESWRNEWRLYLARSYVLSKAHDKAAAELQIVLQNNPNDSRALSALAELFEQNGNYDRAAHILSRILKAFPRHPRIRTFIGDCLVKSGRYDEAEKILCEQNTLFPNDAEAFARMAELSAQRGEKMNENKEQCLEQAIQFYKKARSVDPTGKLAPLDCSRFPCFFFFFARLIGSV